MVLVSPGPVITRATPGFACDTGIAIGHEAGALFVARCDVPDLRRRKAPVKLHSVDTWNPENGINTIGFKNIDQRLTDGLGHDAHF